MPDEATLDEADAALTCEAVAKEKSDLRTEMDAIEAKIVASHGDNQAIGYFSSVLFPPLVLAADHNLKEKEALDAKQARLDRLILLERLKDCPATR